MLESSWTERGDCFLDVGRDELVRLSEIVAVTRNPVDQTAVIRLRDGTEIFTSITPAQFRERLAQAVES